MPKNPLIPDNVTTLMRQKPKTKEATERLVQQLQQVHATLDANIVEEEDEAAPREDLIKAAKRAKCFIRNRLADLGADTIPKLKTRLAVA